MPTRMPSADPSVLPLSLAVPALRTAGRAGTLDGQPRETSGSRRSARAARSDIERTVLQLFDDYRRPVTRYVLSLGLTTADAEDVVQEVFLALFNHLQRYPHNDNLPGWLFQVARNLALRHRRRGQRWWQWLHPFKAQQHDRVDPALGPEALLAEAQQHARWQRILAALPDRDRQCLVLRAEGLTYRDIATALGMSLTSVARAMARAIARFERAEER